MVDIQAKVGEDKKSLSLFYLCYEKIRTKMHITTTHNIQTVFDYQVQQAYLVGAFKKLNEQLIQIKHYRLIPIKVTVLFFSVKSSELWFCCFNIKE